MRLARYAVEMTPSNGIAVQYRSSAGATAAQLTAVAGAPPVYVRADRSGSTFSGYTSSDGISWTAVPGSSVTLNVSGAMLAGLAVTSHNTSMTASDVFDNVGVSASGPFPPTTCPILWGCADVGGSTTPPGTQNLGSGSWTIQASGGGDIWGTSDQFHFVWQTLTGDGAVSARVISQANTAAWAKAGVMLRQTTDPGSAYYAQ
jgi:hypothetical protein